MYEKVESLRPGKREGEDTLLPILRYNSKRWLLQSLWPKLHDLTFEDVSVSKSYYFCV